MKNGLLQANSVARIYPKGDITKKNLDQLKLVYVKKENAIHISVPTSKTPTFYYRVQPSSTE